MRHPKDCFYFMKHGMCKFGDFCSFNHKIENVKTSDIITTDRKVDIKQNFEALENQIVSMKLQIQELQTKVHSLENRNISEELSDDDSDTSDPEVSEIFDNCVKNHVVPEDTAISSSEIDDPYNNSEPEAFRCDICDFETQKENGLKIHRGLKHKNPSLEEALENPEYEGFVLKNVKEGRCFNLYSLRFNKSIGFIHNKSCWSFYSPCPDLPDPPSDESPILDCGGVLHIVDSLVIENKSMDWEHMYRLVVGYSLEG